MINYQQSYKSTNLLCFLLVSNFQCKKINAKKFKTDLHISNFGKVNKKNETTTNDSKIKIISKLKQ